MEKTLYALRNKKTGVLAKVYGRPNGGADCSCETQNIVGEDGDRDWLVEDAVNAEYARLNDTPWYNADHETPSHSDSWNPGDWEVVSVVMVCEKVDVKIPTMRKYLAERYKKSNPEHYKHCIAMLNEKSSRSEMMYSLYDLRIWMDERNGKKHS